MLNFGFLFFDLGYMVVGLIGGLIAAWATARVKMTFHKYGQVPNRTGMTGAQVARAILDRNGLFDVPVERVDGMLSDHYDTQKRVLRLSPDVFDRPSVAAIGVAAHEAGHALQQQRRYAPLAIRQTIAPMASFTSNLAIPVIFIGLLGGMLGLAKIGILIFGVGVFFTLVTLPVEFNASNRAKAALAEYGMVSQEEGEGVCAVLGAAAMTYVASALTAVLYLLYFLMRAGLLGGGDE